MALWLPIRDADPRGFGLYMRHYSARKGRSSDRGKMKRFQPNGRRFIGSGEHIGLLTLDGRALFAWRFQKYRKDAQHGVECCIFRNEGPAQSSCLIREAVGWAQRRWPTQRLFTYCKATFTRGQKRLIRWGECFWHAGWKLAQVDGLRFCWEML